MGLVRRIVISLFSLYFLNRSLTHKSSGAFGGYIAALLCQCARTYLSLALPSSKPAQPDPINSYFQLFSPNTPGTVRLTATLLKLGFRISVVKVEIQRPVPSPKLPDQIAYRTCALGIISMSNVSLEAGLTLPTDLSVPKVDIPDRKKDCEQWTLENDPVMGEINLRSPVNTKFLTWRVKGAEDGVVTDRFGLSVRRTWICRPEGREFDVLSIVAVCDWVSSPSPPL
jgi:Thioesterase-like superfamily